MGNGLGMTVFIDYDKSGQFMPETVRCSKKAWFNLKQVVDKTDANGCGKLGICLDWADGTCAETIGYMQHIEGNKYIVPYRNLKVDNARFLNSMGANRKYWIHANHDGTGKEFHFKLVFPYKTFGSYVNNDQLVKGFNQIKANIEAAHSLVAANKRIMRDNTAEIHTTLGFLQEAKKGKEAITKKVAAIKEDKKKLEANLKSTQESFEKMQKEITELHKKIQAATVKLNAEQVKIDKLNTEGNTMTTLIGNAEKKKENAEELVKQTQAQLDASTLDVKGAYNKLVANTHAMKAPLDAALAAATAGNSDGVVT